MSMYIFNQALILFSFMVSLQAWTADLEVITNRAFLGGDGSSSQLSDLALSPDGNYMAMAQNGRGIYVWNTKDRRHLARFLSKAMTTTSLDIDDQGRVLAGNVKGDIILLTLPTKGRGREVDLDATLEFVKVFDLGTRATSIRFLDDTHAVVAYNNIIEVWSFLGKKKYSARTSNTISSLRVNDSRTKIITSSYDTNSIPKKNAISLFNHKLELLNTINSTSKAHMDAYFQPGSDDIGIHSHYNALVFPHQNLTIPHDSVIGFAFHKHEGYWVATSSKTIILSSLNGLSKTFRWPYTKGSYDKVVFSNDGTKLATWNPKQGTRLWYLPVEGQRIPEDDSNNYLRSQKNYSNKEKLSCTVSDDKKSITITSTKPIAGRIFWRTTESDGEICGEGIDEGGITSGSISIALRDGQESDDCEAFATTTNKQN